MQYFAAFFLEREMSQTNTHFMLNNFLSENRVLCEIMRKSMVKPNTQVPQYYVIRILPLLYEMTNGSIGHLHVP